MSPDHILLNVTPRYAYKASSIVQSTIVGDAETVLLEYEFSKLSGGCRDRGVAHCSQTLVMAGASCLRRKLDSMVLK